MPKGKPGTGPSAGRLKRSRQRPHNHKTMVRDLVMDLHRRIITEYDANTIIKMLDPGDRFSLIIPKRLIPVVPIEHEIEPMDIAPKLEDPELEREAEVYRRTEAVFVRNLP